MKNSLKKQIVVGIVVGCLLFAGGTVGAATPTVDTWLFTRNPLTSGPQGYAQTAGYQFISAECAATKDGVTRKHMVESMIKAGQGVIETDWVTGPSYWSAGTVFKSTHTGYDFYGEYKYLGISKSY